MDFLHYESRYDLTDVPASIHDSKTVSRRFNTIYDIFRSLSLAQSLLKGRNAPICRSENGGVKFRCKTSSTKNLMSKKRRVKSRKFENFRSGFVCWFWPGWAVLTTSHRFHKNKQKQENPSRHPGPKPLNCLLHFSRSPP